MNNYLYCTKNLGFKNEIRFIKGKYYKQDYNMNNSKNSVIVTNELNNKEKLSNGPYSWKQYFLDPIQLRRLKIKKLMKC